MRVREIELSERLGLSRKEMRLARKAHSKRGVDWLKKGREVVWTAGGVERLMLAIGVVAVPPVLEGPVVREWKAREVELLVYRACRDGRTCECYRAGDDPMKVENRVYVRVRRNENFKRLDWKGEPMRLVAIQTGERQYELKGRGPRWLGRW